MNPANDVASYISFLSPEYLSSIGKKIMFVESDIEKVFIIVCRFILQIFSIHKYIFFYHII